jgi:hypothetical protein
MKHIVKIVSVSFLSAMFSLTLASSVSAQQDVYTGSPDFTQSFQDVYTGSPTVTQPFQDVYTGSPTTNQIYQDVYTGSPVSSTPVVQDVYTGNSSYVFTPDTTTVTTGSYYYDTTPSYNYNFGLGYTNYGYGYGYSYPTTVYTGSTIYTTGTTGCPSGSTLVNGVCQISNVTCPAGSTYTNGACTVNTTSCPTGYTLVNNTCTLNVTTCPANSVLVNGVCTANCPVGSTLVNGICTTTTSCPSGYYLNNGVCTPNITNCPSGYYLNNGVCTPNITNCPSGYYLNNGVCTYNGGTSCPSGYIYFNGSCQYNTVSYQTCWNGTTIPTTQVCPSQYKTCSNGINVPISQVCYQTCPNGTTVVEGSVCYGNQYPIINPVTRFNNVVTSIATSVTTSSGRCNGIGLIANGAMSTGWFEYGETPNLGRTTASASIGSASSAPFSNVLANLKPATSYYCRAAMSNQYGTFKGDIVRFTTKANNVIYVTPVAPTKKIVTKKKVVKNEIICTDGSTSSVNSQSAASLINNGQKLVTMQLEKLQGDLVSGKDVSYKLTYKNMSDVQLQDMLVKVSISNEVYFVQSSAGSYDTSANTLTYNHVTLDPYTEATLTWTVRVKDNVQVGKSVVSTGYVLYTVPTTVSKSPVQDEVTAYTVGSILDKSEVMSNDNTKNLTTTNDALGFLPQTLVEWLALIAILFILVILGRSIYLSLTGEDKASNH